MRTSEGRVACGNAVRLIWPWDLEPPASGHRWISPGPCQVYNIHIRHTLTPRTAQPCIDTLPGRRISAATRDGQCRTAPLQHLRRAVQRSIRAHRRLCIAQASTARAGEPEAEGNSKLSQAHHSPYLFLLRVDCSIVSAPRSSKVRDAAASAIRFSAQGPCLRLAAKPPRPISRVWRMRWICGAPPWY
ncbi:hypothetical protein BDW22DRAFT_1200196 [Trametopsis cervina]|nr:hypothetical protein BDW22DRAFT_1200196 [Trametopsis cervina]